MLYSVSFFFFLNALCHCSRFVFCYYYEVSRKHLIDNIVLFLLIASYLHLPIWILFFPFPLWGLYCLKLSPFILWVCYQVEVAIVIFAIISVQKHSDIELKISDSVCLSPYPKFCALFPFGFKEKSSFQLFFFFKGRSSGNELPQLFFLSFFFFFFAWERLYFSFMSKGWHCWIE